MKGSVTARTIAISLFTLLVLGTVVYFNTGGVPGAQAKNNHHCSLAGMEGIYGYTLTGFFSPAPGTNIPLGAVGTTTIGDDGSIANDDTLVVNGVVTENRMYSGTITLNPGNPCTGKITFDNGLKDNFVVVDDGEEIQFIQTAPQAPATLLQAVVTGAAKRQSSSKHDSDEQ